MASGWGRTSGWTKVTVIGTRDVVEDLVDVVFVIGTRVTVIHHHTYNFNRMLDAFKCSTDTIVASCYLLRALWLPLIRGPPPRVRADAASCLDLM